MQNDEIDFGPYWRSTRKHYGIVILCVVLFAGIAALVTFLLKPKWQCDASLMLPYQSSTASPLQSLLKSSADPLEMMKGVIESQATLDYLHDQTGLKTEELKKMVSVQTQKDQNQLLITCADKDQDRAMKIVNDCIDTLRRITNSGNMSLAASQAKIMAEDLVKRNVHLNTEEERLKDFTQTAQTPIDPTQPFSADLRQKAAEANYEYSLVQKQINTALATASKMGKVSLKLPTALPNQESLREKLVQLQYELELDTISLGSDNPQVKALEQQISDTKNLIQSEVTKYITAANLGIDPALAQLYGQKVLLDFQRDYLNKMSSQAPNEALKAARMLQEIQMEQDALKYAREQYEQTKLGALVDPLQWTILVPPYIEDQPVNKKYGLYSVLGGFGGFCIGSLIAFWKDSRKRKRSSPSSNGDLATDESVYATV